MAKLLLGKEVTDALNTNLQTRTAALRPYWPKPAFTSLNISSASWQYLFSIRLA